MNSLQWQVDFPWNTSARESINWDTLVVNAMKKDGRMPEIDAYEGNLGYTILDFVFHKIRSFSRTQTAKVTGTLTLNST